MLTRSADHNMIKSAYPSVDFTKIHPGLSPEEIDLLQRECFSVRSVYAPFVEFRPLPVTKKFVKISEAGYRMGRSAQPWPPREADFVVFVFGGSTTFSYCLRDEETVVAALEQELSAALPGQNAQCYNFGRGFYFSTQERLLFESLLQNGFVPDLAVFIDGLNDHYYADGKPALTEALYKHVAPELPPEPRLKIATEAEKTAASQAVLNRYQHNVRMTKATADAYHVATVFVGQPVPFLKYPRNPQTYPFQKPLSTHELCEWGYTRFETAALKGEFGPNFVWCGDAFSNATTAMYADGIHYSPAGAKVLGRAIVAPMVKQQLLASTVAGASAGESRIDAALLTAAQKTMPREVATNQLVRALESGLWNSDRTALAISIPQPKASVVFVFLRQTNGTFLASDASGVEGGNFGKLGRPRTDYERFDTTPVEWLFREDGWFQLRMRTRAWRGGQRYTVSEPLLIRPDGFVMYR